MNQLNVKRVKRLLSMMYEKMRAMDDEGRDLPIRWSVMHMYSSSQLAKLVALRRGMDMELASIAATLHDIAVIITKKKEMHAEVAEQYVRREVSEFNTINGDLFPKISKEEEDFIINAISKHSDKETYSSDQFVELLKDVDSLDRFLHGIRSEGAYLERSLRVLGELGIHLPD